MTHDCVRHVFRQVGYLCGRVTIWIFLYDRKANYSLLLPPFHLGDTKNIFKRRHLGFGCLHFLIDRDIALLIHFESPTYQVLHAAYENDTLELSYTPWCLSGTVGVNGHSAPCLSCS